MTGTDDNLDNKPAGKFICGVVEGFYGIPWTSDQRKLLFQWMNSMGMTTYMYAPKDDAKHRAFWRDLYSVEEAENLTSLIEAATENNITFVYAISPGLDICFSSSKDVQCLKRKCEQVAAFGCKAFALLFDDIDPELSVSDKSAFQSSACAQVSITNEVYEHLNQPQFYFCPTEYCTSRAVPTLSTSGYLLTVGAKLLNDIHVLWTGSKVISKHLPISEMEEVSAVLKRPPVIWDNIHANDYDPRRVFLGPYDGRSPEIIPYIRGVLTNPNCEFEANYIPLHTLGQWSRSNLDGVKKDIITENGLSPVASDIKLESESDYASDDDIPSLNAKYLPKRALKTALSDWLGELQIGRMPPRSIAVAAPTTIPAVVEAPNNNILGSEVLYNQLITTSVLTGNVCADSASFMQPATTVLVNSLVDPVCPSPERKCDDYDSDLSLEAEPMDCVPNAITDSLNVLEDISELPKDTSSESMMQVENIPCTCPSENYSKQTVASGPSLTLEDLELLINLFYLPFEYGHQMVQLLVDLHHLKANAFVVSSANTDKTSELSEWWEKSDNFIQKVDKIQSIANTLKEIPNQAICYYFYPYLWDLLSVLQVCNSFVRWLGLGQQTNITGCQQQGHYTWMNKEYRESFLSGDMEPWCFQGGLQAEFQRMLPISTAHDLLYIRHPDVILKRTLKYRPYKLSDEKTIYNICLKVCDDGMDGTEVFPEHPQLIGDKLIGGVLNLCPEYSFVAEDDEGVMGYAVAALDAKQFRQKHDIAWVPAMCEKYPLPTHGGELTPAEEIVSSFHTALPEIPADVTSLFPSCIRLDILVPRVEDQTVTKRLLSCVLAALKAQGSAGVHVQLNAGDKYLMEQYRLLGFMPVKTETTLEDTVYLGRLL